MMDRPEVFVATIVVVFIISPFVWTAVMDVFGHFDYGEKKTTEIHDARWNWEEILERQRVWDKEARDAIDWEKFYRDDRKRRGLNVTRNDNDWHKDRQREHDRLWEHNKRRRFCQYCGEKLNRKRKCVDGCGGPN